MIFLKSSFGLKLAMGALGLLLGIGGIAVGAHMHAGQLRVEKQRIVVGQIIAINGDAVTVHTRSGQTGTATLQASTVVRLRGRVVSHARLAVGETVIAEFVRTSQGKLVVERVWIIRIVNLASLGSSP